MHAMQRDRERGDADVTRREINALGGEVVARGLRAHRDSDGRVAGRHTDSWARLPDGRIFRVNRHGKYTLAMPGKMTPWGKTVSWGRVSAKKKQPIPPADAEALRHCGILGHEYAVIATHNGQRLWACESPRLDWARRVAEERKNDSPTIYRQVQRGKWEVVT